MPIEHLLAQSTVTDLSVAEEWYRCLFDRNPDTRPMAGLIEWHLGDTFGVQVWCEPDRAGRSTMVLKETDLDETATRLAERGIRHSGAEPGGGARLLRLVDPDGNRVVLTGP